jgi:Sec-independent protein translocase protein TatA
MPVDLIVVLIVILIIVFMVRGPKTLPKWGAALGNAFRSTREEASKAQAEIQKRLDDDETRADAQTSADDRPRQD